MKWGWFLVIWLFISVIEMKLFRFSLLILFGFSAIGQEVQDSVITHRHTVESHPIWTGILLSPTNNPALAGFNRVFSTSYSFLASNLNIPNPAGRTDRVSLGFWKNIAEVDAAVAGPHKNLGLNLTYNGGQSYWRMQHSLIASISYRLRLGEHRVYFGNGMGASESHDIKDFDPLLPDQSDPRGGWLYPTNDAFERRSMEWHFSYRWGISYAWRGLYFGYSGEYYTTSKATYESTWSAQQTSTVREDRAIRSSYRVGYQIDIDHEARIIPQLGFDITPFGYYFQPTMAAEYKGKALISISSPFLRMIQLNLAYEVVDRVRIGLEMATYFQGDLNRGFGMARLGGSLRYRLRK